MNSVKKHVIDYCRESGCPVQGSIDTHRANGGSENEIRLIKHSHCVRCDIWRIRKWMEAKNLKIIEDVDPSKTY